MNREHREDDSASKDGIELSVIAPCLNEEANIPPLVDRTLAVFDSMGIPAQLVLVDDGSTDRTWGTIYEHAQNDERVRGVRHTCNQGMVAAWKSGLNAAAGGLVCLIDADLQNRPEDIPRLYEAYRSGSRDVVQAVRHPARGVKRNHLFSRALNHILNIAFRMRSRDNKSGFVLCRRDVLTRTLEHRYRYRYFQNLLGVAVHTRGYTIAEVDTVFDQRYGGQSFLSALPLLFSIRVFRELVKFRIETLRSAEQATGVPQRERLVPAVLAETTSSER